MSEESKKKVEEAKHKVISIQEQINYLNQFEFCDEQQAVIKTLNTILDRYTSEEELVQLTLPKHKWNDFLYFETLPVERRTDLTRFIKFPIKKWEAMLDFEKTYKL